MKSKKDIERGEERRRRVKSRESKLSQLDTRLLLFGSDFYSSFFSLFSPLFIRFI